jgi:hypothetical protein
MMTGVERESPILSVMSCDRRNGADASAEELTNTKNTKSSNKDLLILLIPAISDVILRFHHSISQKHIGPNPSAVDPYWGLVGNG